MKKQKSEKISQNERFEFGANWKSFSRTLNDERIQEAERSLKYMLGVNNLHNKRFLDIGSGSGLFSLAAKRLGAIVHSFDYDAKSVACTCHLKEHYFPNDDKWTIEEASALDDTYLSSLGKFDIVYSWGVLHHTGDMKKALENAMIPVSDNGILFIAIYNDQGMLSHTWRLVKKTWCSSWSGKILIGGTFIPLFTILNLIAGIVKHKNPLGIFHNYKKKRGMSIYHDWIDWLGGHPFEVAKPEDIFDFYRDNGYILEKIITTNGQGCNQFVFSKSG